MSLNEIPGLKKVISKSNIQSQCKRNLKMWTISEDENLRKYYDEYDGNWKSIAQMLPGRNISQCSQRWRRMNRQQFTLEQVKFKWTLIEDMKVLELVQVHGKNWGQIAKQLIGRTGKQIRERYLNKLNPILKHGKWSMEEDEQILKLYQQWGSRWSRISGQLQGRSENMVKNRFYTYIKRVFLGEENKYQIIFNQKETIRLDDSNVSEQSAESSNSQPNMNKMDRLINDEFDQLIEQEDLNL